MAGPPDAYALTEGFRRAFEVGAGIGILGVLLCVVLLVRGVARPEPVTVPAAP